MKKLTILGVLFLYGCSSDQSFKEKLEDTLVKNPGILKKVIEKNPLLILKSLQKASVSARESSAKDKKISEQKMINGFIAKPLKPKIRKDENFLGNHNAKITLVEYSDFQCPYCTRGANVVNSLLDKYKGNIRFVYKHLPLSFHDKAMISSKYYEAIRLQNPKKAFKFHDEIFKNQAELRNGEKFLKKLARKLKVNMKKLSVDINSDQVKDRIDDDMQEAKKFGFQGTPGFLLNGIPIKGAYPQEYFVSILEKLKKEGKI